MSLTNRFEEIREIETLFNQTLKLISIYKKHDLPIPFALKGNLGEFLIQKELLERFPNYQVDYKGGSHPGYDISIDGIKIQVKTQIKHKPRIYKKGKLDFESSPTIKKDIIEKRKCEIIILLILYPDPTFSQIEKKNIYIFNQNDFKHFKTNFCWSGKKGDKTIVNIISINGELPPKRKESIEVYNSSSYKKLFKTSKDNWKKIKMLLK